MIVPERAMVLAAGRGERMRPITSRLPKPLIMVAGRTLLDRALDRLEGAGVAAVTVNVHYLADQIEAHLGGRRRPPVTISREPELLDTGGGVAKALPLLCDAPFFVHNSDSIWTEGVEDNLLRMRKYWDSVRMDCLMLLAITTASTGYDGRGDFTMDFEGRVTRRGEHEIAPFAFTGVSIMHPRLFEAAPAGAFSLNRLWDRAIGAGRLYGLRLEGRWMHVGSPLGLADAERALANQNDA